MDPRSFVREALTIGAVLAAIAVIALLSGGDRSFLRDLAGEWLWWIVMLVAVALVGLIRFRRRR